MNLLYLTFGDQQHIHAQAVFSICSFLKDEKEIETINIITDHPDFYNLLQPKVNVIAITKPELKDWEGEHQFFWRVKIKAIEKICALYPGKPVMYVDTDTFSKNNLGDLKKILHNGKALMHENEGHLSAKKSKTEKKMWSQLKGKSFGGQKMQETDDMWNAGVVATPNTLQNKEMELALSICDEMCQQGVTPRLIEQYAISLALNHLYGLEDARRQIIHYWAVKDLWNQQISNFFLKAYFYQWPLKQLVEEFDVYNFSETPFYQHNKNTNSRLKNWIDRRFPPTNAVYLKRNG